MMIFLKRNSKIEKKEKQRNGKPKLSEDTLSDDETAI